MPSRRRVAAPTARPGRADRTARGSPGPGRRGMERIGGRGPGGATHRGRGGCRRVGLQRPGGGRALPPGAAAAPRRRERPVAGAGAGGQPRVRTVQDAVALLLRVHELRHILQTQPAHHGGARGGAGAAARRPPSLPAARSPQPARRPGLQPAGLLAPPPAPPRPPAGPTRPPAVAEPPGRAPGAAALPLCAASSSACPERRIPGEGVPGPNPCSAQPAAPPQADTRPRSHWASRTPCPPYPGPAGANTPSPGVGGQPEESPGPQRPGGPAEPREQTTGNY